MNRIVALIMALIMLLSLSACGGETPAAPEESVIESEATASSVNLAYNSVDTLNPYTAKTTLNKNLCSLLFDPLIKNDSNFNAVNVLAQSIECDEKNCIVILKTATFTDGTPVTPDDVVYSFNLAKEGENRYTSVLKIVESAKVRDKNSVVFTLKKADPNAASLLTFPIIKIGSDQLKNEDNVFLTPIGCGRYTFNEEKATLDSNKNWHGGKINIEKVTLIDAPDNESLAHSVEVGAIDYYYTDLSDCNIIRMSGERINIPLNNLVYVGLNTTFGLFKSSNARQAISAGLDRKIICEEGYYNNALAATGIFNPEWNAVLTAQTIEKNANVKIAIENLEEIGYNKKDSEGYLLNSNGKRLTLSLLVNKENAFRMNAANLIKKQLREVGIAVNIKDVSFNEYKALLKAGSFDMYIAETNIPNNMDISHLVVPSGSMAYGLGKNTEETEEKETQEKEAEEKEESAEKEEIKEKSVMGKVISSYYSGVGNIPDIAVAAISEMPIVPVCYRTGVLFTSDKISVNNSASADDIFLGFENITFN